MSGLIGKLRGLLSPSVADSVSDTIEEHVTSERIHDVLDKVPGGDKVRDHVPEDAGKQLGGAVRGFGGSDDAPKPGSSQTTRSSRYFEQPRSGAGTGLLATSRE